MNIKSNQLKAIPYPDEFTEEDKLEYDRLYAQAKILHAEVEKECPFIIHISIIAHIRSNKGLGESFTNEELEQVKKSYELSSKEFKCDVPQDHFIYNKDENPIYFPSKLIINNSDVNSNVENNFLESKIEEEAAQNAN